MKKLLQICLIAVMSLTVSMVVAQPQPSKKVVVETSQFLVKIDNPGLEKKIMTSLSNDKGVIDVNVDAKKNIVTVRYNKDLVNNTKLLNEFQKMRIKAEVIKPMPPKR